MLTYTKYAPLFRSSQALKFLLLIGLKQFYRGNPYIAFDLAASIAVTPQR